MISSESTVQKAARRQQILMSHLLPRPHDSAASLVIERTSQNSRSVERAGQFYDDDVAIISAVRTPICKAFRGEFRDTSARDLLSTVLKAVVEQTAVDPGEVGDIAVGMVLGPAGKRTKDCRMAMLEAGFPEKVPIHSLNRQCGSGLQAVADIAASIKAGFIDIGASLQN